MGIFSRLFGKKGIDAGQGRIISIDQLKAAGFSSSQFSSFDGDKFFDGFGNTKIYTPNYWLLRQRSQQLFNDNLYARGLIRRLVTNEINTGLSIEAQPVSSVLQLPQDMLDDWSQNVEERFALWANNPNLCDVKKQQTFSGIQQTIRRESLIEGDVLVVLRQSGATRLPMVEVVSGSQVQTPLEAKPRAGNKISSGVEIDNLGRHVAFYVGGKRVPAFGEKSGRRIAWMVYGTDKRHGDVRGQPILSLVLQSLREVDKYRDSVQRKAVVNSMLAIFIKKTKDAMGSLPFTAGAQKKTDVDVVDQDGSTRKLELQEHRPGLIIQEMQVGEEPVGFGQQGIDLAFGPFESTIINAVAWANEMPPEILTLAFTKNYSASAAAIKEFKMYLEMIRQKIGDTVTHHIYVEWLLAETLLGKIEAPGFLESWRNNSKYDIFAAWIAGIWYGSIKPSTDAKKEVQAAILEVENGFKTRAKVSRELNGSKFSDNIKKLRVEAAQIAELRSILTPPDQDDDDVESSDEMVDVARLELIEGGG